VHPLIAKLKRGLVVSCQATPTDLIRGPEDMAQMARSAEVGGAVGIRANGSEEIAAIRHAVKLPIIGIYKQDLPGYGIRITPSVEAAAQIVAAGADIIALDATRRGAEEGRLPAAELIRQVKATLNVPVMADIATFEEGVAAAEAGADIVASTLSGYTAYSPPTVGPDFDLVARLVEALNIPVIAEGRISTPDDASRILALGGYAVVVGSMITRPRFIVEQYVRALKAQRDQLEGTQRVIAVDIGGTKIAAGVVDRLVAISCAREIAAHAHEGGQALLKRTLDLIAEVRTACEGAQAIGVATAGEVGADGSIIYATDTIPGYKGTALRKEIEATFKLPTAVENDGRAATLGEALVGAGRGQQSVLGLTIGTGIGGGLVNAGRIYTGAARTPTHFGHLLVERNGRLCSCGKRGCLEAYVSGPALIAAYNQQTGRAVTSGEAVVAAARSGDLDAISAIRTQGEWFGYGLASLANLFNPSVIVVGGGMSQMGRLFFAPVEAAFREWAYATLLETPIITAQLGPQAGLFGAALLARQRLAAR
jgi:glucokinase-like ROK family protein